MPLVKGWAASLSKINSRDSSCRRRSSAAQSVPRRVSETSVSNMDINDSEGTLVSTTEIQDAQRQPLKQPRESLTTDSIVERQAQGDLGRNSRDAGSIERRVDYCVVEEAQDAAQYGNYTGVWAGETADSAPQTRSRYFGDHIHQNAYRLSNKF